MTRRPETTGGGLPPWRGVCRASVAFVNARAMPAALRWSVQLESAIDHDSLTGGSLLPQ